ncbi:MAG: hypothetical protein EOP04_31325, partial [Proteobacteria bacterium]
MRKKWTGGFVIGSMISTMALIFGAGGLSCKTSNNVGQLKSETSGSELSSQDLAQAMKILGAKEPQGQQNCAGACHVSSGWHSVGKSEVLEQWVPKTQKMHQCFETAVTPIAKIDCFRVDGRFTSSSIKSLGLYRAGARYAYFKDMFTAAFGADSQEYKDFLAGKDSVASAIMPAPAKDLTGRGLTEEEFQKVLAVVTNPQAESK